MCINDSVDLSRDPALPDRITQITCVLGFRARGIRFSVILYIVTEIVKP